MWKIPNIVALNNLLISIKMFKVYCHICIFIINEDMWLSPILSQSLLIKWLSVCMNKLYNLFFHFTDLYVFVAFKVCGINIKIFDY